MGQATIHERRRALRKALGPVAAEHMEMNEERIRFCTGLLRRRFWGRVRWLLFGR